MTQKTSNVRNDGAAANFPQRAAAGIIFDTSFAKWSLAGRQREKRP
jgi:hypothetical protein